MKFKVCQDIGECRILWDKFSTNKRLFDVWGYRVCFYDTAGDEPYFIVGYENEEAIGLIPLCFVKSKNQYTYFGGWFPERNSFFLEDKTKLAELLEQCPENTFIEGIDSAEGKYNHFLDDEYTYYLDLSKYDNDFEKYFSSFDRKKQKNFKRELQNIPKYQIYRNRLQDFDKLVELNIKQYEEDSKFNNKTIKNGVYKMIKLANKDNTLEMMSLEIDGRTEAIDVGISYGGWYYAIIGGANNQKIPNLGKLMTILDIKNAISRKAKFVDFFATSGYWKDAWHFDKEMLLKFVK